MHVPGLAVNNSSAHIVSRKTKVCLQNVSSDCFRFGWRHFVLLEYSLSLWNMTQYESKMGYECQRIHIFQQYVQVYCIKSILYAVFSSGFNNKEIFCWPGLLALSTVSLVQTQTHTHIWPITSGSKKHPNSEKQASKTGLAMCAGNRFLQRPDLTFPLRLKRWMER